MPLKYPLFLEPGNSMFVFEKNGKVSGHFTKDKTAKALAKFVFETAKYDSIEILKANYPEKVDDMLISGFILPTDLHVDVVMKNQTHITVWQNGEIIEDGGIIESYSKLAIVINGSQFMKETCVFKIK